LVAKRYGALPSQVLKLGNSIDVRCAILAMEFENYQYKKHSNKGNSSHNFSTEQLQNMMQSVRAKDED